MHDYKTCQSNLLHLHSKALSMEGVVYKTRDCLTHKLTLKISSRRFQAENHSSLTHGVQSQNLCADFFYDDVFVGGGADCRDLLMEHLKMLCSVFFVFFLSFSFCHHISHNNIMTYI